MTSLGKAEWFGPVVETDVQAQMVGCEREERSQAFDVQDSFVWFIP